MSMFNFILLLGLLAFGGATDAVKSASSLLSSAEREFRSKSYDTSLKFFNEALANAGSDDKLRLKIYYGRHKVFIQQSKLFHALSDLTSCIEIDKTYALAYAQRANINLMTGNCADAVSDYRTVITTDPTKARDAQTRLPQAEACSESIRLANNYKRVGNWAQVRAHLDAALSENRATMSPTLLAQRAEAAFNMGEESYPDALADFARVLKLDANNLKAYASRGLILYLSGDYATARAHFQQCLKVDPEYKDCKEGFRKVKTLTKLKEAGESSLTLHDYAGVLEHFREGCTIDTNNKFWMRECFPRLARAYLKLNQCTEARRAAQRGLALSDELAEAHHIIAECLMKEENWEEAVRSARRAHEIDKGNHQYRDLLTRAEAALKQSKTKDYYKILGVSRNADQSEIKKSYRKLALEFHPDRVAEDQKEAAQKRFQDIGEAYEVLSDPEKRGKFDRGEDVGQGGQEPPHHHHQQQHFHQNFGFGGGGFSFRFN